LTLKQKYESLLKVVDDEEEFKSQSLEFRELAHRLSLSYGIGKPENELRSSLELLIQEGVLDTIKSNDPESRYQFLGDGISKFVSKLTSSRAALILKLAKEKAAELENPPNEDKEGHHFYFAFIQYLEKASHSEPSSVAMKIGSKKKEKGKGKRKKSEDVARDFFFFFYSEPSKNKKKETPLSRSPRNYNKKIEEKNLELEEDPISESSDGEESKEK